MEQIDQNRFNTMAHAYDRMCRYLVPQYDFLQDEVLRIVGTDEALHAPVIVDLGAGSGIFLERALTRWPNASAYWVDSSEAFRDVAQEKLGQFNGRVRYVLSAFEEDWEPQAEKADLIFSMSAIHHLESTEKRALYQRAFDALKPGGWFFNVDEMQTLYKDGYLENMRFWVKHVQDAGSRMQEEGNEEQLLYYEKWTSHFSKWEQRNVTNIDVPKVKGDDLHESFLAQVNWLHDIGFTNADVFIKYHLWCVVGGRKDDTVREGQ